LKGVVGQDAVVGKVKQLLEKPEEFPHLLFHSAGAGTGKTTVALIIAQKLLDVKTITDDNPDVRIFNASKMPIETLRTELDSFARHQSGMFREHKFGKRIAILEEIDYLRKDIQGFLRRQIEELQPNCVFIATCNDINKISKPIVSRLGGGMRFSTITKDEMTGKLKRISKKEKMNLDDALIDKIYKDSDGDMRLALNFLQSHGGIDIKSIEDEKADLYKLVSSAMRGDKGQMVVLRKSQKEAEGYHVSAIKNMAYSLIMTQKRYDLLSSLENVDYEGGDIASANLLWAIISGK
jgi:DNA polymerase III delta prime subunit